MKRKYNHNINYEIESKNKPETVLMNEWKNKSRNFKIKTKTQTNIPHNTTQGAFNKLEDHISNNTTKSKTNPNLFIYTDNSKELEEYRNSSDCEQIWEIAIDKWTRN